MDLGIGVLWGIPNSRSKPHHSETFSQDLSYVTPLSILTSIYLQPSEEKEESFELPVVEHGGGLVKTLRDSTELEVLQLNLETACDQAE